jgi:isochorismate synthase
LNPRTAKVTPQNRAHPPDGLEAALRTALRNNEIPPGGIFSIALLADGYLAEDQLPVPRNGYCWSRPLQGQCMAGTGIAARFIARGPNRFVDLSERYNNLRNRWTTIGDAGAVGPVAFTGFSFDPDEEPGHDWHGFANAMFVVPSVVFQRRDGVSTLTFSASHAACPTETMDPNQQVAAWLDEMSLLFDEDNDTSAGSSEQAPLLLHRKVETDDWDGRLARALQVIRDGPIDKVVVTRRARFTPSRPVDCRRVFRALAAAHPECAQFSVAMPEVTLLGVSPERLVSVSGEQVVSDALAGTAPRGRDPEEDDLLAARLMDDSKTREEHSIVVDQVRASLEPVCIGVNVPSQPNLKRLPRVQHLWSPVRGRRSMNTGILDFAARLHPTPAVGGSPREKALEWLSQHGESNRGWYTGAFGWMDAKGDGELSVVLRCGVLHDDRVDLFAGAGIVAGSDPDQELAETEWKLLTMRGALQVG